MRAITLLLIGLLIPLYGLAATYLVKPDLVMDVATPASGWRASPAPPAFLVDKTANGMSDGMFAKARKAGLETREQAALKMLGANELFVYNPASRAYLQIDLSSLRDGEKAPAAQTLKRSACYAGESLAREPGISAVDYRCRKALLPGLKPAYRVDADYQQNGHRGQFSGIVGFVPPYWVYLYYTDPLSNSADRGQMEQLFGAIRFFPKQPLEGRSE